MDTSNSNLAAIIAKLMAAVNEVMTKWEAPNGTFDSMPVKIGIEDVTSQDEAPQVYWVPESDDGYHVAQEQPDDGLAVYETWTVCRVQVWGRNLDEAERLRNAVLVTGWRVYSDNAWDQRGKGTYSKGLVGEDGVAITFRVAFKIPILVEEYPLAAINQVNFQAPPGQAPRPQTGILVSGALGQNPQPMEQ